MIINFLSRTKSTFFSDVEVDVVVIVDVVMVTIVFASSFCRSLTVATKASFSTTAAASSSSSGSSVMALK